MKASQPVTTTFSLPRRMGLPLGLAAVTLLALGGCSVNGKRIHNPIHIKHHRVLRSSMALPPST
jgi:hypothetical protein